MRRMKRYQLASYECLIIKYAKDERYELNGIATHDKYVHFALVLFNLVSDVNVSPAWYVLTYSHMKGFYLSELLNKQYNKRLYLHCRKTGFTI